VLGGIEEEIGTVQKNLENLQRQLENAKADLEKPFDREDELAEKTRRLNQLNILLNMSEKDSSIIDTEPEDNQQKRQKERDWER